MKKKRRLRQGHTRWFLRWRTGPYGLTYTIQQCLVLMVKNNQVAFTFDGHFETEVSTFLKGTFSTYRKALRVAKEVSGEP